MTSVSLVLLTGKPVEERPVTSNSELYTLGMNYYYGLAGKPKNYTRSFEKFIQAAEQGEPDAMCMVSQCYIHQQGVDADPEAGLEWLVRAINTGRCNYAKNDLAMIIVAKLKETNPNALREYFAGGDDMNAAGDRESPDMSRDFSRANSSILHASYSSAKSLTQKTLPSRATPNQRYNQQANHRASQQSELDSHHGSEDDFHLSARHYQRQNSNMSDNHSVASQSQFDNNEEEDQEVVETVYDLEYAFRLLVEAATEEPGVESAKTNLGVFFEECGDIEQAAKWYSLASNGGCSRATCKLATLFFNSATDINKYTLTNNRHKAFSMYKMSAVNGEIEAFNGLGQCYETGVGVDSDLHLALINYLRGATAGDKQAMYNYGYIKIKNALDVQDSMRKMKQHSKYYLATHLSQHRSAQQSYVNAAEEEEDVLYRDMAGRADAALQEGLHWLRCAAENGVADASYQIGQLYEKALGVPQDSAAALSNYLRAAKLQHAEAALFAANLLFEQIKSGADSDIVTVMDLYLQAAESGLAEGMNSLAILLEDGATHRMPYTNYEDSHYALTTDIHTAATWYYAACQKGLSQAFLNLALILAGSGNGGDGEQLYSFTALNGELITSEDAKRFIENRLSSDIRLDNDQQTEMVMNVLDSIQTLSSEEHKQSMPQLKSGYSSSGRSNNSNNSQSGQNSPNKVQPSLGRSLKLSSSTNNKDFGSLVLKNRMDNAHQKVNFASNTSSKSRASASTPHSSGSQTPNGSKLRNFVDLNSIHSLKKSNGNFNTEPPQLSSQQQTNKNFKSLSSKVIQSNSFVNSFSHVNNSTNSTNPRPRSVSNTVPLHTVSASYNSQQGGASPGRSASAQGRSGEIFTTNGPIPPPNYVPKAAPHSVPQGASKPEAANRGGVAEVPRSERGGVTPPGNVRSPTVNNSTSKGLMLQHPNAISNSSNNHNQQPPHPNFTTGDSLVGGAGGGQVSSPVDRTRASPSPTTFSASNDPAAMPAVGTPSSISGGHAAAAAGGGGGVVAEKKPS
eukprot:gene32619-40252_t